ncbi:SigB/SigF/SigG family RNA polymerase sigma factor [Nocardiopsis sp. MG754419]|uniref:SigB/SigF/SigG family RNA polymerase sigma factor n=1 Tax=Nocardiopsis sp. MG754419 TaxID=2259865 RepID=UPI001BA9799A|nr:SigB/SigF/SigG family RNA polymerase sigma factor [Nocardiopsis sp. MG754419]MBR8742762.1 B/F/G family RNA polymerase sigma-70 factor [Nocardiopsis sp. MG754419]
MFQSVEVETSSRTEATAQGPVPPPRRPVEDVILQEESDEDLLARLKDLDRHEPFAQLLCERLIRRVRPLVKRIALDYRNKGEPIEDVTQVAMEGLLKSIRGFDPGRGTSFVAYLRPTVHGEIKRHFRDHTWAVHVPRRHQEDRIRLRRVMADFQQDHSRRPTREELARVMGLTEGQVTELLQAVEAYRTHSMDRPETAEELGSDPRLGIEDPGFERVLQRESLRPALARLDARARAIVRMRFFGECTQREIGERLGCSQMHVSRLLREVLDTLRAEVTVLAPETPEARGQGSPVDAMA